MKLLTVKAFDKLVSGRVGANITTGYMTQLAIADRTKGPLLAALFYCLYYASLTFL